MPAPTTAMITTATRPPDEEWVFRTTTGRREGAGEGAAWPGTSGTVQTFWQRGQTVFAPATAFASLIM
jgi:hypothetical protein